MTARERVGNRAGPEAVAGELLETRAARPAVGVPFSTATVIEAGLSPLEVELCEPVVLAGVLGPNTLVAMNTSTATITIAAASSRSTEPPARAS